MSGKQSSWTEELEEDFRAWLDDIDAGFKEGDMSVIDNVVDVIYEGLPVFVLGWTVAELCSAIRDR